MRVKVLKLALGVGFAAAFAVPALACDFHTTSAQNEQPMAQSQQSTPDTPQTAESQPAPDTGSN
jgi:cytoskeletal protein RodZ